MIDRAEKAFMNNKFFAEFVPSVQDDDGWYEHNIQHWGTKWDISGGSYDRNQNEFICSFDTAWSPPIEFYRALTEQGFDVKASYYESGMGFVGEYSSEEDDTCYKIEEFSKAWIQENIPEHLDEIYYISESIEEEYEDEDEDY